MDPRGNSRGATPTWQATLTIAAVDRSHNQATTSFILNIPPLSFHRRIVLDTPSTYIWATRMVAHPTRDRLLIAQALLGVGTGLFILDTNSLELVSTSILPAGEVLNLALDSERDRLYLADYQNDDVLVVSALTGTVVDRIADADPWATGAVALAIDKENQELYRIPAGGGLFFADSPPVSFIGIADLATGARKRLLRLPHLPGWGYQVRFVEAALDETNETLFIGTADWTNAAQGILKVDGRSGQLLGQVDVVPEDPSRLGGVRHLLKDGELVLGVSESNGGPL